MAIYKYKNNQNIRFITVMNDTHNKTDIVIGLYKPGIYKRNNKSNNNKPKTMKRKESSVNSTIPLSKKPKTTHHTPKKNNSNY